MPDISEERLDRLEQKLDKVYLILVGNGAVGLCEDVRHLKRLTIWLCRGLTALTAAVVAVGSVAGTTALYHYLTGEMTHLWPVVLDRLKGLL